MIFDGLEPGTLYNIYLVGIDEIIKNPTIMNDSEVLTYRITTKNDDSYFLLFLSYFFL